MNTFISDVQVDQSALTPLTLRFPKGLVTYVHPANITLMQKAATRAGFSIEIREVKGGRSGVFVVPSLDCDPQPLFDEFARLQVERSNKARVHSRKTSKRMVSTRKAELVLPVTRRRQRATG